MAHTKFKYLNWYPEEKNGIWVAVLFGDGLDVAQFKSSSFFRSVHFLVIEEERVTCGIRDWSVTFPWFLRCWQRFLYSLPSNICYVLGGMGPNAACCFKLQYIHVSCVLFIFLAKADNTTSKIHREPAPICLPPSLSTPLSVLACFSDSCVLSTMTSNSCVYAAGNLHWAGVMVERENMSKVWLHSLRRNDLD